MSARPEVSDAAERLYERLAAFQDGDPEAGWRLLLWCEAMARIFQRATDALRHDEIGSGRRRMYDPDRCPAWRLPALAERAGVDLPPGINELDQRRLITEAAQLGRGRPLPLMLAIAAVLGGGKHVRLLERHDPAHSSDDKAGHITFVTRTAETPPGDVVMVAAMTQKAAGLIPHHVITDGVTWDELGGITWDDLVGVTWDDMESYTI